jgi:dynein heavy chain
MCPPGAGRPNPSAKLPARCALISIAEFDNEALTKIFTVMLDSKYKQHSEARSVAMMVTVSIDFYEKVKARLLPTPAKCHYLFNLRDLSQLVQGLCRAWGQKVNA